ncbi:stabilin-1 isoform X2 [Amblyraja radiata]|uniref:stabilin-1 isoform X2 n=1 Tax=Amblyraja radiata TaxID=386614 RepID=UPI0014028D22|nr:stabilin-1 isoform X2 [Amblyraja radiata]
MESVNSSLCAALLLLFVQLVTHCPGAAEREKKRQHCNEQLELLLATACTSCAISQNLFCPRGFQKVGQGIGIQDCSFTVDMGGEQQITQVGCRHMCKKNVTVSKCCKGYWSQDCLECPGGFVNPCNGHGPCSDGITGNGRCVCDPKYKGMACEECADEKAYGPNCVVGCKCVHGICNNGITGDGSCICFSGYTGPQCEQEMPACKTLQCGNSTQCIMEKAEKPTCSCLPGFQDFERACVALNPCTTNICAENADCEYFGEGKYQCICHPGYHGNEKLCLPINPCSTDNGGCPERSTTCKYEGPGQSSCKCKDGFIGNVPSEGCTLKEVCKPSLCNKSAKCVTVSPGNFECACKPGQIGDGRKCIGPIREVIEKLLTHQFTTAPITMFDNGCLLTLSKLGPFTVFLPLINNLKAPTVEEMERFSCKQHIVSGILLLKDLVNMKTFETLAGDTVDATESGTLRLQNQTYTLVRGDIVASNGIIHIIDHFLVGSSEYLGNPQKTIAEIFASEELFSRFETILENCDLPLILDGPGPYTVFAPSNEAVDTLRDGTLFYMFGEGRPKLQELVKHHIFSSGNLPVDRLSTMSRIMTKANQIISINVTANGRILLGDTGVPVHKRDIAASNGIIHTLDGILIPSSIIPILPKRCDKIQHRIITAPCGHCSLVHNSRCPDGSTPMESYEEDCLYHTSKGELIFSSSSGCARHCNLTYAVRKCCKGFYGPDCKACLGGFQHPCYGHGECSDGIEGDGTCKCYSNFKGIACHICSEHNKHGQNCTIDCPCLHGICDNRPENSGICQPGTCMEGFTGTFCDQKTEPCGPYSLSQYCHAFAVCEYHNDTARCRCKNGYKGDGISCQVEDLCKTPYRGGCAENAECFNLGPGNVTCLCNTGWTGDGRDCIEINECLLSSRGGCDENADCQYIGPGQSHCVCKRGFAGDGMICSIIDPCVEENGGCHVLAECEPTKNGNRKCTCLQGYAGDGMMCFGDILTELASSAHFSSFNNWLQKSGDNVEIPAGANVTVLVPSEAAIEDMDKATLENWEQQEYLPMIVKSHFIMGGHTVEDLKEYEGHNLSTMNIFIRLPIKNENGSLTIRGARIVMPDIAAVNGYIHIIDQILIPPLENLPQLPPGLLDLLEQLPQYSYFKQLLQQYHLIHQLESSKQYTILIPENAVLEEYYGAENIEQLVKYHIIPGEKLLPDKIKDGIHKGTMLGSLYQVIFYRRKGQIFVNDVPLNDFHNVTRNGILLGTTHVLQLQKNRCDTNESLIVEGTCGSCDVEPICPEGTAPIKLQGQVRTPNCNYKQFRYGRNVEYAGCRPNCTQVIITLDCCVGYFGARCQMCPGMPRALCSNYGICQDGINGTGECLCHEGFQGTACESCEAGRYGTNCALECLCANGNCNDGLDGDGSCYCYKGWESKYCDKEIVTDHCNGTCHPSANCILGSPGSLPSCLCSAGYTGNGSYCSEINPCVMNNGGCSDHSNCTNVSTGERTCTCWDGYVGDGLVCLEIDGCVEQNGGCHENAECTKTGPNLVACNCLPGYNGDGRKSCQPNNPCKKNNGGCGSFARCKRTGPGTRTCSCYQGYKMIGRTCRGVIFQELEREPRFAAFHKYLQRNSVNELEGKGPFTVFVPKHSALSQTTIEKWESSGLIKDLLRYHIVGCGELSETELKEQTALVALSGNTIQISSKENVIYLNGDAQIITTNYITANGIIHYINKVLVPFKLKPNMQISTSSQSSLITVASENGYKMFSNLIKETNLLPLIEDPIHKPFTMMWPTDKAFNSLPKERKDWLFSKKNRHNLVEYLKFHMIRDSKTLAADLPLNNAKRTMQGSVVLVSCNPTMIGDLIVNDGSAQIVQRHLEFDGGIAYGINSLLEPPSVGAQCDALTMVPVIGKCGSCLKPPFCPPGSKPQDGSEYQSCYYAKLTMAQIVTHILSHRKRQGISPFSFGSRVNPWSPSSPQVRIHGCSRQCVHPLWIPRCCKNHYGPQCQECPGGIENPCSFHGKCNEGKHGNGTCDCSQGFRGTACELCGEGRYGSDCKKCNCSENGICDDGIAGEGTCFCKGGWTGKYCESQSDTVPVCYPKCDSNAVCRRDNNCECKLYYEGDGRQCTVVNRCEDSNGGCHRHAECIQVGVKVTCTCHPDYEGDGNVCMPKDKCLDGRNGGCHEHAICFFIGPGKRRCECKEGFRGDGIQCLFNVKPPIDRCLEMDDQCHLNAFCEDLHFQDKTAGVFHLQSPDGKYKFTYDDAVDACNAEGATLASFDQLATAQQFGYHLCVFGWMAEMKAGYPITHINPSCGYGNIGVFDYGVRANVSEQWDAYCFRMQDIQCICKEGFVGDGYFCNGNLMNVISSHSNFSIFYTTLLDYGQATEKGKELLEFLSDETTNEMLFIPLDSSLGESEALSWSDLENHVTRNSTFLFYDELSNNTLVPSRLGYDLHIGVSPVNNIALKDSKLVNGILILKWDIIATNGIIHAITGPLTVPSPLAASSKSSHIALGAVLGLLCLIGVVVAGLMAWFRRRNEGFRFQYFKSDDDDNVGLKPEGNPALVSVPNPLYGAYGSASDNTAEPFEDDDEYESYSYTQKILHD